MQFWNNPASGRNQPVVALRSDTHAAYMAQDCSSTNTWDEYYDGFGMWGPRSDPYSFTACYHTDSNWMLLEPAIGYNDASVAAMPYDVHAGVWDYRLVELAQSPMWQHRNDTPGAYPTQSGTFFGTSHDIGGGQTGLPTFGYNPQNFLTGPSNAANPPWEWLGGGNSCGNPIWQGTWCWFTFRTDKTGEHHGPAPWSTIPVGALLTDPAAAARAYFWPWNLFRQYVVYNTYLASAPPPGPPPMSVSVVGPDQLTAGTSGSWSADVQNGTPPYSYQWSGPFSGTASTIDGVLYQDASLYLDVTDAASTHVSVSYFVSVPNCGTQVIC